MRFVKMLLIAGIAVPVLYFSTLLLSSLFYPGYSHISQYASELGSAVAPYPLLFNMGIILAGLCSIAAGFGCFLALRWQTGTRLLPALLTLCLVLFGVSFVTGVGGLVTRANVGLWQRTYVLSCCRGSESLAFILNRHLVSPTEGKPT